MQMRPCCVVHCTGLSELCQVVTVYDDSDFVLCAEHSILALQTDYACFSHYDLLQKKWISAAAFVCPATEAQHCCLKKSSSCCSCGSPPPCLCCWQPPEGLKDNLCCCSECVKKQHYLCISCCPEKHSK